MDIESIISTGRCSLSEGEVKTLLKENGIHTTDFHIVQSEEEIDKLKIKYPVIAKVHSPDILHKTDVGGIFPDIKDVFGLTKAFREIKSRFPDADMLVEPMEEKGVEVIIGFIHDATFGPTIMFGMGGIYTEIYKDVSFRLIPLDDYDADDMMSEIKSARVLEGFRNIHVNREALKELLISFSRMCEKVQDTVESIDLNPVFAREKDVVVVDAKAVLKCKEH